jgi:hypothetical protein
MLTIRRLYLYAVAAASLATLVTGLALGGAAVLDLLTNAGGLEFTYRQTIAGFGAATLVALPLWLVHWVLAQRLAARDPSERTSTLRRLYIYGVMGGLLIAGGSLAYRLLGTLLAVALGTSAIAGDATVAGIVRLLWEFVVVAGFWAYTLQIAMRDSAAVGETGGSATLRRWYTYGAQFAGLLLTLFGAAALLDAILIDLFAGSAIAGSATSTVRDIATTLVGLAIWLIHRFWTAGDATASDDRGSTLRAVYGFSVLAVSVVASLASAGQIFYWIFARVLGVQRPSGLPTDLASALARPIAALVVFGAAWALSRRDLARDGMEAGRQRSVRRLYRHVIAFLALGMLVVGATTLLWSLVDRIMGQGVTITPPDFRDQIAFSITFMLVGMPLWLLHWRPEVSSEERLALSRRLYLFACLLLGVLAVLGSAIRLASYLLTLLLNIGDPHPALQIGHALSWLSVALAVVAYHGNVLRRDNASRDNRGLMADKTTEAEEALPIVVEITGATEADVRTALKSLPTGASLQFRTR